MNMPALFLDHAKRNLILWATDMVVAIASYFYVTNPFYIQKVIDGIDFATLRPDVDPQFFMSPVFSEFVHQMVGIVAIMTIAIIVVFHTWAFYRCYQRKTAAIAYVKIYTFLAAVSLLVWFVYNLHFKSILILIPAAIYICVFMAERQPKTPPPLDNVLSGN